jgi:hypothetical protein
MTACIENPAAPRAHLSPLAQTHGRHGAAPRGMVTHPPFSPPAPASPPALSPPARAPVPADDHPYETTPEPDAPPAVMPAPIDDVDG